MKKILAFIGLILYAGMGSALCSEVTQWKCPAHYTPQLTVNGQPFKLLVPSFDLQKSTFPFGDYKAGIPFLCFYGTSEDDTPLSFYKLLYDVKCSFDKAICNKNNCHCLGGDCVLTCTDILG